MSSGSIDPAEGLSALDLPRDGHEPVFAAPWQAQAFALVVLLHRQGRFTWPQWVEVLSQEIARAPAGPGETASDAYYRQWLAALERIVVAGGLVDAAALDRRSEQWRRAYLGTPHGQPVLLENASRSGRGPG